MIKRIVSQLDKSVLDQQTYLNIVDVVRATLGDAASDALQRNISIAVSGDGYYFEQGDFHKAWEEILAAAR